VATEASHRFYLKIAPPNVRRRYLPPVSGNGAQRMAQARSGFANYKMIFYTHVVSKTVERTLLSMANQ
jgi:hypothetical protein